MFAAARSLMAVGVVCLMFRHVAGAYTYTCHPNSSIDISGLESYDPVYYFAITLGGQLCNVSGDSETQTATITDCPKDTPIYFTYGTYEDMLDKRIHGGGQVSILNIRCSEIDSLGEMHTVSKTVAASLQFDSNDTFSVEYEVTSSLSDSSASVGQSLTWTISFPGNYFVDVRSCTAKPFSNTQTELDLIKNGCSETDFLTEFSYLSESSVSATILAFKFYNSFNVHFSCSVKMCPESFGCIEGCSRRRKRAVNASDVDEAHDVIISDVLHITDAYSNGNKPVLLVVSMVIAASTLLM